MQVKSKAPVETHAARLLRGFADGKLSEGVYFALKTTPIRARPSLPPVSNVGRDISSYWGL